MGYRQLILRIIPWLVVYLILLYICVSNSRQSARLDGHDIILHDILDKVVQHLDEPVYAPLPSVPKD